MDPWVMLGSLAEMSTVPEPGLLNLVWDSGWRPYMAGIRSRALSWTRCKGPNQVDD